MALSQSQAREDRLKQVQCPCLTIHFLFFAGRQSEDSVNNRPCNAAPNKPGECLLIARSTAETPCIGWAKRRKLRNSAG